MAKDRRLSGNTPPGFRAICDAAIPSDSLAPEDQATRIRERLSTTGPVDLQEWVGRLKQAGVRANRRGCPNLALQLEEMNHRRIDAIVCNLLDSDMTLRLNAALAAADGLRLWAGLGLLGKLTGARKLLAASDGAAPYRWSGLANQLMLAMGGRVIPLLNDYPSGDPTVLLNTLLKKRLKPHVLPTELGVVVVDAPAAIALGAVVLEDAPMRTVPFAARDHAAGLTHWFHIPVNVPTTQVLAALGIDPIDAVLRFGDVLRDQRGTLDDLLGTGELTLHVTRQERPTVAEPCVRCAWCVESCPTRINPAGLLDAAQQNDLDMAEHYGLDACIECGICTYVCPSKLPLLGGILKLKKLNGSFHSTK